MPKKGRDPIEIDMQRILCPGQWFGYQDVSGLVGALEQVHTRIDQLMASGSAERAERLCRSLVSACYEKANELDDSDGYFGDFVQGVFCTWIKALQVGQAEPSLVVKRILEWVENDDYGFCHNLESEAVKVLDTKGLRALEQTMLQSLDESKKNDYTTRHATDVLKQIYVQRRQHEAYIQLCQRTGLEADDCATIADILRRKRRPADALAWVDKGLMLTDTQERSWRPAKGYRLPKMKRELLKKLGRPDEALESAWEEFASHPSRFALEELMRYAPRSARTEWRSKALEAAGSGPLDDYMDICVDLKEWSPLANAVLRSRPQALEALSHYTSEPAAKGMAPSHPGAAARLFAALCLRIVNAGKSRYYWAALENIAQAKKCFERADQVSEWQALVAQIRAKHHRKSGFMPGFERVVAGTRRPDSISFLEKAKRRRRWL